MLDSIYSNQFVFEKHGPYFSEYISMCIHNYRNVKTSNTERHHILPKCLHPDKIYDNSNWNLVHLPYELHQQAHWILSDAFPEHTGLKKAKALMNRLSFAGENHPLYGTHLSEATRKKISDKNRGKIRSDMFKRNLSDRLSGEGHHMYGKQHTAETRKKISESLLGTIHTAETRQQMSKAALGKPKAKTICPHCGKEGSIANMKRWHFQNCINRLHNPK